MRALFHSILLRLATFEEWFDQRFGWFFTNGMKDRSPARDLSKDPATGLRHL